MHFAHINTITLNTGSEIKHGLDEMTFVTDNNTRDWEGFMYGKLNAFFDLVIQANQLIDVSFCQQNKKANHFRCMVDPRGSARRDPKDPKAPKWQENELCGFSAKNIYGPGPGHLPERSKMIPIYKGDGRKMLRIGSHDCYREYYCTAAVAPIIGDTWENRNKGSIDLWVKEGKIPPRTNNLRRRIAADEDREPGFDQEHLAEQGSEDFVDVGNTPPDVEVPLDMTGGNVQGGTDASSLQPLTDIPDQARGSADFDHVEGDDVEKLYNDGDF